jgi:hypothetical protein
MLHSKRPHPWQLNLRGWGRIWRRLTRDVSGEDAAADRFCATVLVLPIEAVLVPGKLVHAASDRICAIVLGLPIEAFLVPGKLVHAASDRICAFSSAAY